MYRMNADAVISDWRDLEFNCSHNGRAANRSRSTIYFALLAILLAKISSGSTRVCFDQIDLPVNCVFNR